MPAPLDPGAVFVDILQRGVFVPLTPYEPGVGTVQVRCRTCDYECVINYHSMVSQSSGCAKCAGFLPVEEQSAIAEVRAVGVEPSEPFPGLSEPWRGVHECGAEIVIRLNDVRHKNSVCRNCGYKRNSETKRLPHYEQGLADYRAAGCEPLDPSFEGFPGVRQPWAGTHLACGNEVAPRVSSLRKGQGPCRHCAKKCPPTCACSVRMERAA